MAKLFISCTHKNNFYPSIMISIFNLINHLYRHITVQEKQNHPAPQATCLLSIQSEEVFAPSRPPTTTCILRTNGPEQGSTASGSTGCPGNLLCLSGFFSTSHFFFPLTVYHHKLYKLLCFLPPERSFISVVCSQVKCQNKSREQKIQR